MSIATLFDYADVHQRARALCSQIAFGDGDPADLASAASDALGSVNRHRQQIARRQMLRAA